MKNYGEYLKAIRENNNLTQSQLARNTGISQQNISLWEQNKRIPSIEFCEILADFYEITIDELIGRDTIPNNKNKYINSFNNFSNTGDINIK